MLNYFPKYFTSKAIALYFIALVAVTFIFFSRSMNALWMVFGALEVVGFFYFSNLLTRKWNKLIDKTFRKRLMYTSAAIRIVWVVFSYFFYMAMTGQPFEFGAADSMFYDSLGKFGSNLISNGNFNFYTEFDRYSGGLNMSDTGFPIYLSFIYFFTGNSMFVAFLIKALISAWTCVFVYKLAVRNFGEQTGRMAAILCMLMPNLIIYCSLQLKEVEMVFLSVVYMERVDHLIRSKSFTFRNIAVPLLVAIALFSFRTVLGVTALFALLTALLFSTQRILGFNQRLIIGLWVAVAIAYFMGGRIATEIEQVWADKATNQKSTLEWRTQRQGGNKFSDRAGAAIFAPAIFIIPIPTMVNIPGQENQQLIHGGNFVKDILAFFLVFFFIFVIRNNKWRDFSLIEAFFVGYLVILAFSAFAQSERYHQPVLPFYMMFAAYGISQATNKTKFYFNWYMVGLFFVILAWNWFKLAGRGLA